MSKTHLKSLLQNYSSIYPEEIASKEKMLKFLDESQDPFNKSLQSQLNENILNSVGLGYKEQGAKRIIIGETTSDDVSEFKSIDYIGHFTASAFLLNNDQTKFFLLHHKKLDKWIQVGGHCEETDNNILDAAFREAKEESGINEIKIVSDKIFDIDVHHIPQTPKEPAHYHYDIRFLLKTLDNDNFTKNDESHQAKWFSFSDYPKLGIELERSVTRMIKKSISLI